MRGYNLSQLWKLRSRYSAISRKGFGHVITDVFVDTGSCLASPSETAENGDADYRETEATSIISDSAGIEIRFDGNWVT